MRARFCWLRPKASGRWGGWATRRAVTGARGEGQWGQGVGAPCPCLGLWSGTQGTAVSLKLSKILRRPPPPRPQGSDWFEPSSATGGRRDCPLSPLPQRSQTGLSSRVGALGVGSEQDGQEAMPRCHRRGVLGHDPVHGASCPGENLHGGPSPSRPSTEAPGLLLPASPPLGCPTLCSKQTGPVLPPGHGATPQGSHGRSPGV